MRWSGWAWGGAARLVHDLKGHTITVSHIGINAAATLRTLITLMSISTSLFTFNNGSNTCIMHENPCIPPTSYRMGRHQPHRAVTT